MKKLICLLLAALMMLSLFACGASEEPAQEQGSATQAATEGAAAAGFRVGFGRADITPEDTMDVHLAGYGDDSKRPSEGVMDYLYTTCVAITDENGETVLLVTTDMMKMEDKLAAEYRKAVEAATGIPAARLTITATHSHSTPSLGNSYAIGSAYSNFFQEKLIEAVQDALADQSAAIIQVASHDTDGRKNWVRHYTTTVGVVVGDNFETDGATDYTGHTTEADSQMQIVRFVRDDKKDIVMINWQGHPTLASTGSSDSKANRTLLSSDYVGPFREYVEKEDGDCLVAFYLGASGNLNSYSRITGETFNHNHRKHGEGLGAEAIEGMKKLETIETGTLKVKNYTYPAEQPSGAIAEIEVNAIALGELAIATVPYEMYDVNGMTVKNESPYKLTMMFTMTDGYYNYVAADYTWEYNNCYETRSCRYVKGTGEAIAADLVKTLTELKG